MFWLIIIWSLALLAAAGWFGRSWHRGQIDRINDQVRGLLAGEPIPKSAARRQSYADDLLYNLDRLAARQRELKDQLSEEEFNLKTVLGGMMEALVVVDSDRRVRLANSRFMELFELQEDPLHRDMLESVREADIVFLVRDSLASGESQSREVSIHPMRDGSRKVFAASAVPIKDASGYVRGAVTIFHDISRLKLLEHMRRDFVANVSHELRTPLSIFRGYLETLLENPKQPPRELHRILEIMEKHSMRLNLLVDDLLSLARLESYAPNLQCVPIRLRPFLSLMLSDWKIKFSPKSLAANIHVEPDNLTLVADEARLEEVIHNLLDNAVKYSSEGGAIEVRAVRENEAIVLSVSDRGAGIPMSDLPHIFERFYRVDKARSREQGGTGLGLSIVKHIVQLHGGTVEAVSELRKGTTIRVNFPATEAVAQIANEPVVLSRVSSENETQAKER